MDAQIAGDWRDKRKWIKIRRLQDLPAKFHKGLVVTQCGLGKCKIKGVFRVSGYRDLIALVGTQLEGLGIPAYMDHNRNGTLDRGS